MIIITGAAGFIGSNLVGRLNSEGITEIILVDDFGKKEKELNYINKKFLEKVERNLFHQWLQENSHCVQFVFHIGARTDTTEFNKEILDELNFEYSKELWKLCTEYNLPLVYASSAATYGAGEFGYDDSDDVVEKLRPLNPYGESKNEFDKWVLNQSYGPKFWAGLKFFNVYGPNEYHKRSMASVIFHGYNQIRNCGKIKLFRSHHSSFRDGEQLRDFIYVKDVVDVLIFFMNHQKNSGIYNLGTGKARTFLDLATSTFNALDLPVNIEFIDTPIKIRDKYQYFTEAKMDKLRKIGYTKSFTTLELGVNDYVKNYLVSQKYA